MKVRILSFVLACLSLTSCLGESVDLTGKWEGTASMVVDGDQKETPLVLELRQSGADIGGTILWGDFRRDITAASAKGPEIDIESATTTDRFRMKALFRNEALEGRFWIHYAADPEPFPGRFKVNRKQ